MTSAILVQCSTNWAIKPRWKQVRYEFNLYPLYDENDVSVYDKDHMSELRIKNRSERDKKQRLELKEKCPPNKPIRMAASTAYSDLLVFSLCAFPSKHLFSQLLPKRQVCVQILVILNTFSLSLSLCPLFSFHVPFLFPYGLLASILHVVLVEPWSAHL